MGTNLIRISFQQEAGYGHVDTLSQDMWKFGQIHDLALMQKFL